MSSEVPRVYRELIEEVIRSTDEDNYRIGIDKTVLEEIKNTWIAKICEYTDIGEYKIRHSYQEARVPADGYYDSAYGYPDYAYRDYPYPYYPDRDDKDEKKEGRYDQYDGMSDATPALEEELDSNDLTESDCGVDNEESTKNVMLCLFDKVTRVKDKRRCTLKHGFLSIGRTDYTFNMASGDLEW
ncbi:transcription initiation factor TFIIA large subunit [Nematocida displodere]|uniref:Transcription initiation factor TFIIA large subunit n=1 Tax=Nematocida displodere TaxID=1805483 RepID=A0A177EDV1_9MICR|nr:transcription initiation factor TFIIA large subunit [Nematocida displodere]